MGKSYKAEYNQVARNLRERDAQVAALGTQLAELQAKSSAKSTTDGQRISEFELQVKNLETEKEDLEGKNVELNTQLRQKELGRFASAYAEQEGEYKTQQDLWFTLSLWATGLLTVSVVASIFSPLFIQGNQWYEKSSFYLLDVIFLTLFVYALKQHAHLGNLRVDYANRKTLAQSYQYIIEDEEEGPSEIKTRFLNRAADIFSSEASTRGNDVTLYEALVGKVLGRKE